MSTIQLKEHASITISLVVLGAILVFVFKAGQAYNRLDGVEKALNGLQASVNACLSSCPRTAMNETIAPQSSELIITKK